MKNFVLFLFLLISTSPIHAKELTASWYGPGFHGRRTASGEIYDQTGFTAAHKSLPFGTRLRVCFNKCTEVTINDRGPFISGRDLDLSFGAADAIGLINPGVNKVNVTFLD